MVKFPGDADKSATGKNEVAFRDMKDLAAVNRETGDTPIEKGVSFRDLEARSFFGTGEDGPANENKDLVFTGLDAGAAQDALKEARRIYNGAKNELFKIFRSIQRNEDFSIDVMLPFASDFVSHILKETDCWLQIVYTEENEDDLAMQIVIHSLNTAVIAVKIGAGLDHANEKIEALALRAFFHDVGMLRVPTEVVQKTGSLTPGEIGMIKEHPKYGYEILSKAKSRYTNLAKVTYQEHERHDGSGYPQGLKNGDISDYSLIIGVADIYSALIHPRPYRPRYLPFDAVKQIIITSKGKFPNNVMKALVNEFSTFPKGIFVRLNSKEVGRVVSSYKIAPLRPVVEIIYDANGKKLAKPKTVDMFKDHILQIEESFFTEEDIDGNDKSAN